VTALGKMHNFRIDYSIIQLVFEWFDNWFPPN
jgi:hypothetical protein